MFKRQFRTAIDDKHVFGSNDYILGRISGIMYAMCGGNNSCAIDQNSELDIQVLTTKCTARRYDAFADTIEELYPGLCVFDYGG